MENWESTLNQTEPSANNMLTHEPWAWQKSVVGRAHELKRDTRRNVATSTSLAFYNSHSFLRPLTNEHTPFFVPAPGSVSQKYVQLKGPHVRKPNQDEADQIDFLLDNKSRIFLFVKLLA